MGKDCHFLLLALSWVGARGHMRDLIQNDEEPNAQESLEALLMQGLHSGEPTNLTRRDWDEIRGEALKRFESRKVRKTG